MLVGNKMKTELDISNSELLEDLEMYQQDLKALNEIYKSKRKLSIEINLYGGGETSFEIDFENYKGSLAKEIDNLKKEITALKETLIKKLKEI